MGLTEQIRRRRQRGGRLAKGRQEGKLWACSSSVVSLGFFTNSLLLWGLILVYTQMAPCIFLGQCVSAHVPLLCVDIS